MGIVWAAISKDLDVDLDIVGTSAFHFIMHAAFTKITVQANLHHA